MKAVPAMLAVGLMIMKTFAQLPDNLVGGGVPAFPAELQAEAARYTEFRAAAFQSWHPKRREMIITTCFADSMQLHQVKAPGAARKQLTFLPEPVAGGRFQPKTGECIVFSQDMGGGEFYQLYRYDVADGRIARLELQQPGVPDTNGIPYITVDEVRYNDRLPWPLAADGNGPSLQRKISGAYGNDPINWTAAAPSPGIEFVGGTAPSILAQPQNETTVVGDTASYVVSANGTAPLNFRWTFYGTNIPGAINTTLVLPNIQHSQAGLYGVVVFNAAGSAVSLNATQTVLSPVAFILQPQSQLILPGTNVTISADAVGNGTLRYQWRFEGTNILNATNASYSFTNASLTNHGNYSVTVTDDISMAVSSNAFIFIKIPPGIVMQPVGTTNLQWQTATFSVIVTGAPPLNYRWLRQGVNFLSNAAPTLVITNLQPNIAGSFRVTITNLAGLVNSTTVNLGVIADTDADGLPDFWETNYVGNATNMSGTADPDGDGMINRDEYVAGTDPTNALSVLKLTLTTTNTGLLEFVAQTNIGYTMQYRTNLNSAVWNNITSIAAPSLMQTVRVNVPSPPPEPARFYRIVTPPVQ